MNSRAKHTSEYKHIGIKNSSILTVIEQISNTVFAYKVQSIPCFKTIISLTSQKGNVSYAVSNPCLSGEVRVIWPTFHIAVSLKL